MKYNRFEELPVWQDAIELAIRVYDFTARPQFKGYYSLKDQLERATVSISNNVAEGFERGTTQELITFLYISRGSSGKARSVLCLCDRLKRVVDLKSEISDLRDGQPAFLVNFGLGATLCRTATSRANAI